MQPLHVLDTILSTNLLIDFNNSLTLYVLYSVTIFVISLVAKAWRVYI